MHELLRDVLDEQPKKKKIERSSSRLGSGEGGGEGSGDENGEEEGGGDKASPKQKQAKGKKPSTTNAGGVAGSAAGFASAASTGNGDDAALVLSGGGLVGDGSLASVACCSATLSGRCFFDEQVKRGKKMEIKKMFRYYKILPWSMLRGILFLKRERERERETELMVRQGMLSLIRVIDNGQT